MGRGDREKVEQLCPDACITTQAIGSPKVKPQIIDSFFGKLSKLIQDLMQARRDVTELLICPMAQGLAYPTPSWYLIKQLLKMDCSLARDITLVGLDNACKAKSIYNINPRDT